MADCWLPSAPPDQEWSDITATTPDEVFTDSSIAAIAISGISVAGMPKPDPEWVADGHGPIFVCGEV